MKNPDNHFRQAKFRIVKCTYRNELTFLFVQVAAAAGFTPVGEMERRRTRVEKGVMDFFKEEWVENLKMSM